MVIAKKVAANKFEKIYKAITETIDERVPKISACFFVSFPVGIGLRQVLVIKESRSDSYHIFNAPAAPDPNATAIKEQTASEKSIFTGAIKYPTAQVNKTNDITRGFIKLKKALMLPKLSNFSVFVLIVAIFKN